MRRNSILTLILVLAAVSGIFLSGCASTGLTAKEVDRQRHNTFQHDLWQLQDDFDSVLMIDRPSRLSERMVR